MRRKVCRTVLAITICTALAVGCRTNQSPERQVYDIKITAEVKSKLASDVRLSTIANIDVNTTNGVVTLSGQVNSDEMKQRAQEVAQSVPNVRRVNNNLQVGT